jgi:hypothetical protein
MERIASVNRSLRRATSPQAPVVTSVSSASALLDGTLRLAASADISWGRLPDPDPDISMPPAPGEPAPCTPFQINPLLPERLRGELRGLLEAWRHIAFAEDLSQLAELHATPFEIKLTTNTPVSVPARRMNPTSRAFVQQELAQMEQHGIILLLNLLALRVLLASAVQPAPGQLVLPVLRRGWPPAPAVTRQCSLLAASFGLGQLQTNGARFPPGRRPRAAAVDIISPAAGVLGCRPRHRRLQICPAPKSAQRPSAAA